MCLCCLIFLLHFGLKPDLRLGRFLFLVLSLSCLNFVGSHEVAVSCIQFWCLGAWLSYFKLLTGLIIALWLLTDIMVGHRPQLLVHRSTRASYYWAKNAKRVGTFCSLWFASTLVRIHLHQLTTFFTLLLDKRAFLLHRYVKVDWVDDFLLDALGVWDC